MSRLVTTPPPAAASKLHGANRALESAPIPGDSGRPLVGHTLDFLWRTQGLMDDMRARHGANFRMQVFGRPVLILGSPEAVREVLLDKEKNFSSKLGWGPSIGELFAGGLMLRDFDDHRINRRIMQSAFRADAMRGYVDTMTAHIPSAIASWPRELQFYPALKQLTLDLAARIFLGLTLGGDTKAINRAFVAAVAASIAPVRSSLPITTYGRGLRGRRVLERLFTKLIRERRQAPGNDLLSQLCQAKSEEGERFSDREISDHMIFLMMAAHDTTTSSLSLVVHSLLENPTSLARVCDEVRARGGVRVRWDDRDKLPVLDGCFDEALRMFPPAPFLPRLTLRACTIAGLPVPANSPVAPSALVTHRLPEYWTAPDRFDPDRFSAPRSEHTAHSHLYYPFGGGAHVCMGLHFARIQVKAVLSELFGRYDIRTPRPVRARRLSAVPIPFPRDGLPVILQPI
jgi:cytochrome P450